MASISGFTFKTSTAIVSYAFVAHVHEDHVEITDGNHHYFYQYKQPKEFVSEHIAGKKSKITLDVATQRVRNLSFSHYHFIYLGSGRQRSASVRTRNVDIDVRKRQANPHCLPKPPRHSWIHRQLRLGERFLNLFNFFHFRGHF
jgi:hypothetical protein